MALAKHHPAIAIINIKHKRCLKEHGTSLFLNKQELQAAKLRVDQIEQKKDILQRFPDETL